VDRFELSALSFELMSCFTKQLIHLRVVISEPADFYQFDRKPLRFSQIFLPVFI
jgi:hypothetical protein